MFFSTCWNCRKTHAFQDKSVPTNNGKQNQLSTEHFKAVLHWHSLQFKQIVH
jgi:hypothetical protein